MALTDTSIRMAKPGLKPIKLSDEKGLFLLLQPSGGKLWRLKYRFGGKEKKLGLGRYPEVSLKEARSRRDDARTLLASGVDPSVQKKRDALQAHLSAESTFDAIGKEYLDHAASDREAVTIGKSRWLLSLLSPSIGKMPITDITARDLLAALRKIEEKGHLETTRRMRSLASRVFRYAISTARAETDPTHLLRGALKAPRVKHRSAILDPQGVGQLMLAIDGFDGQPLTKLALQLSPHVFLRPGELRQAEWSEIDLEKAIWTIPETKMKMRVAHHVPLSRQSIAILESTKALSGHQRYVFSCLYARTRPMSENTINGSLRRMGYGKEEMTAHGFRAMASSLLNESGKWNPDAIERALSHNDNSSVRGAYHRGSHWQERVTMAQWWSDHLDELRSQATSVIV